MYSTHLKHAYSRHLLKNVLFEFLHSALILFFTVLCIHLHDLFIQGSRGRRKETPGQRYRDMKTKQQISFSFTSTNPTDDRSEQMRSRQLRQKEV